MELDFRAPHATIFRRGDPDAPNKLAIAICTLGVVRIETSIAFALSGMPMGQAQGIIPVVNFGIQDARNIGWHMADAKGYEYFMFWDDDVLPARGGYVETLLETMEQHPQIDILGGVYPARQNIPSPIVLKEPYGSPWWGWEDGGIHKVWMTGTGFTMYRMSSIKKLPAPTKKIGTLEIKEYFRLDDNTDDCVLARDAEKAGLSWYVHGKVICDQIETVGLRFQVKNARQRITEEKHEDQDSKGNNNRRPARSHARQRRPADVRAR